MYTPLFRVMLGLTHFVYTLSEFLRCVYVFVLRVCRYLQWRYIMLAESDPTIKELDTLRRTLVQVNKVPQHLVIMRGMEERLFILDCVRIIGWCITLDIPYLSLFDRDGFLKQNKITLKREIAKKWPNLVKHITWNSHTKATDENRINGSRSKITISLLSDIDGKGNIVTLTQSLAMVISSGELDLSETTDQLINEKLQMKGIPNPDLVLIYGNTCSTHGLLPWHTKSTEFLILPLYVNVTVKDIVHVLQNYSKRVQRHGK